MVLLDLLMPGMEGAEGARRLRADGRTAGVPIVVLSACADAEATAAWMGADDVLVQPFGVGALYATVARWVATPALRARGASVPTRGARATRPARLVRRPVPLRR